MRSNNVEIRLGAGDFCISSNMWPYQSEEKESFSVGGLLIPHGVLSPLLAGGQLTRPAPVSAGSPLGSLLGAAFDAAITQVRLSAALAILRPTRRALRIPVSAMSK
jgi:hypothetical protein